MQTNEDDQYPTNAYSSASSAYGALPANPQTRDQFNQLQEIDGESTGKGGIITRPEVPVSDIAPRQQMNSTPSASAFIPPAAPKSTPYTPLEPTPVAPTHPIEPEPAFTFNAQSNDSNRRQSNGSVGGFVLKAILTVVAGASLGALAWWIVY